MPLHTSLRSTKFWWSRFVRLGSSFFLSRFLYLWIWSLILLLFAFPNFCSAGSTASTSYVMRVRAGAGKYTDSNRSEWRADRAYKSGSWGYVGGKTYSNRNSIANTSDDPLYQSVRYGNFSYRFDVSNGFYNVSLHFAEIYWQKKGKRIFDVFIEGLKVLDNYDICAAVGCKTAVVLTFPRVQVQDGQLNIHFITVKDNAKVSAISITGAGGPPPPPPPPPPPTPSLSCNQVGFNAFYGCYYNNSDFTNLALTRTDPQLNFSWGLGAPAPSLGPDTFSVKWEGDWNFSQSGTYRFTATTDDGMRIWIDNTLIFDQWFEQAPTTYTVDRTLTQGTHRIKVEYYENEQGATAKLSWSFVSPPPPAPSPTSSSVTLRVHPTNPRYFADGSGKGIYLTGSHVWQNFSDWSTTLPPSPFDFTAYLDFLQTRKHNFIRLWRWELTRFSYVRWGYDWSLLRYSEPHPWARPGPGTALDGRPKFDLNRFNQAYFDRLRERVIAARDRGIYVSIMVFEGHGLHSSDAPWRWNGHPMNAANNINGINGDPNGDGYGMETQTLDIPSVTAIQKAYLRKVIDTVNDLDNVLYEIINEAKEQSVEWQYEMTNFIKSYEATKPKQHPVGMTASWAPNDTLSAGPADWISPGEPLENPVYSTNPPATHGTKVILLDTDHMSNNLGGVEPATHTWVWKSFTRGYNPIYMDPIPSVTGDTSDYGNWTDAIGEDVRWAMGHTRNYADKMNLAAMTPRGDLTSTDYALANPGQEYLVYAPSGGNFTVNLSGSSQDFRVEWFNPATGISSDGGSVAGGANRSFSPPFSGDAVLYLKASGI